tara:strand:+ start:428 stop:1255 length:828 start_codon:yes stop_codon:yes gene_type:complete
MKAIKKQTVLFLCTGNSARSQLAEVLLKHKAGDRFETFSAGTDPGDVDIRAIEALKNFGLNTNQLISKNMSTFSGQVFDYIITLCDKANNEYRHYPNAGKQLAWDLPDPKIRSGSHPFFATLNELDSRLSMFILVEEKLANLTKRVELRTIDVVTPLPTELDPISFYKSLTDDIRLKTLMLTHYHGELCVCELMAALKEDSQPKVSRNLAILKKAKVIIDRKNGQWVFYRINPELPLWAKAVIAQTTESNASLIANELQRLNNMKQRPSKTNFCK